MRPRPRTVFLLSAVLLCASCVSVEPGPEHELPPIGQDGVHTCCPEGVWRELTPLDGREPDPAWCTLPARPILGTPRPPPAIEALMRQEPLLDPANFSCPTDFSGWVPFVNFTTVNLGGDFIFDDNGVPMSNMEQFAPGTGYGYAILGIASYLVSRIGDLLHNGPSDEVYASIRGNADWLVNNGREIDWEGISALNWEYDFPGESTGSPGPWVSGYSTGIVVPALVAAYCAVEDPRYLDGAERSLRAMALPAEHGGVATWIRDDRVWLEEGTDDTGFSTRILNGHIAAAAGIEAVARWAGSDLARALFEAAAAATKDDTHLHDAGFITTYMQWAMPGFWPMVAHTSNYNRFQTTELSWLYTATGDVAYLRDALQMAGYDDPAFSLAVSDTTLAGYPDYARNQRMVESWTASSGSWTEWTMDPPQELEGVTMWAHVPGQRPDRYVVDVETADGVRTLQRPWPHAGCNDTYLPLPDLNASRVRMTVYRDDGQPITMRSAGLHANRGLPTAVGYYGHHGITNRPAHMFEERGWSYPRLSWVTIDTEDTWDEMTLSWSGWLSATVLPTLRGGETLESLAPLTGSDRRERGLLTIELVDPPRYIQVEFPELVYAPERAMWARGR